MFQGDITIGWKKQENRLVTGGWFLMDTKKIYLAGGCFWGVQKYFDQIKGVVATRVGYANGYVDAPTYEEVKKQNTGHAETVMVEYDPQVVGLGFLLEMYYKVIDPVSVNKQGEDQGTQYRTGIFWEDETDRETVESSLAQLQEQYSDPLAVEYEPLKSFFDAEDYHQEYLKKHPSGYCHISQEAFEMAAKAEPEV